MKWSLELLCRFAALWFYGIFGTCFFTFFFRLWCSKIGDTNTGQHCFIAVPAIKRVCRLWILLQEFWTGIVLAFIVESQVRCENKQRHLLLCSYFQSLNFCYILMLKNTATSSSVDLWAEFIAQLFSENVTQVKAHNAFCIKIMSWQLARLSAVINKSSLFCLVFLGTCTIRSRSCFLISRGVC